MALFTLNINNKDFYYSVEVLETECANIYTYTIVANTSDSITITLTGDHENEYYILNGTTSSFTDTTTVIWDTSLTLHFSIENSGNAGIFNDCEVELDNTTQVDTLTETVERQDDSAACVPGAASADYDGLSDTPGTKTGSSLKLIRVNVGETAHEYFTPTYLDSTDIDTFAELDAIVADKSLINLEDGGTFITDVSVPDEVYGVGWNASLEVPTKNAVYDKIETLSAGSGATQLSELSDVNTSTPTNKFVLVADGIDWESRALVEADISDLQAYLTAEVNDLTASVTWANVPNINITEASVTQHQGALSITESQISDLAHYTHPTGDGNLHVPANSTTNDGKVLTASVIAGTYTWETIPAGITDHTLLTNIGTNTHAQIDSHIGDASLHFTEASISITESQISDLSHFTPTSLLVDYSFTDNSSNWNTAFGWGDHASGGYADDSLVLHKAGAETVTGIKTFQAGTLLLLNSAKTFSLNFSNNITADREWTIQDASGTVAFTSDVISDHTGLSNIGTNTHAQIDSHIGDATLHFTQASISITESQISDLQAYLLTEVNDLSAAVTWEDVPDAYITQTSVLQYESALTITESQISDLQAYILADPSLSKAITIPNPVATDDATIFFTPVAITVTDVRSHITGTTNVVFNIGHASTRTGTQLDVFTSDITLTSTAGQSNNSGFSDATIPANSWVWLDVVSVSGTPTMFHGTIIYTED